MSTDYYAILGIPKNANETEIKKAYRSMSLKYHPDRNQSPDAEARMHEINESYETLKDPQKKKMYDMGGGSQQVGNPEDFVDMNNIFNMLFGGGGGHMNGGGGGHMHNMGGFPQEFVQMHMNGGGGGMGGMGGPDIRIFHGGNMGGGMGGAQFFQNLQRPPPIIKNIQITLEQSYSGCTIPLEIERWVFNNDIKVSEIETLYVNIPTGMDDGEYIILTGYGNKVNEQVKGDIKLGIQLINNTDFKRHGLDIVYKKVISLKDALCGFTFDIDHLNGKTLTLNNFNRTIIKPDFKKMVNGMGMVRDNNVGNLCIEFEVLFPDTLTEEQVVKLSEIL
jgi:DnaJ family protein B protein 4